MQRERFHSFYFVMGLSLLIGVAAGAGEMEPSPVPIPPASGRAAAVGTEFTYQGRLSDGGSTANGVYDYEFKLFDAASLGNQVGTTVVHDNVAVVEGLFTVGLDFGTGAFGGGERWLAIGVRPGASGGAFTALSPRQKLTAAPYALALPNVYTDEGSNFVGVGRDFRVSGNEVFGVRFQGNPNQYGGMYVETSDPDGWPFYGYATNGVFRAWTYVRPDTAEWRLYYNGLRLRVPASGGLRIGPSIDYSLVIENTTGSDGIRVLDTGDDAIQIGNNPDISNYGVYIPSPGVSTYGLWPNTSNSLGEWALYTVDNIQAGNVVASGYSLLARVEGPESVTPGDVVTAARLGDGPPGGTLKVPTVRPAGGDGAAIGVVQSRMELDPMEGAEKKAYGDVGMRSTPGAAAPGDYVSLIVSGVTEVKVDRSTSVVAGQRLTASAERGRARTLRTEQVNGMTVAEGTQVIGIALDAPALGADMVPILVTLK